MLSGQQQLHTVILQIIKARNCKGADTASATRNRLAGMHAAAAAGAHSTRVQQPCTGSGSGGGVGELLEREPGERSSCFFDMLRAR
jgi:hypothetical protein